MKDFIGLLRNGNKSALYATVINTVIAAIKGTAFGLTGNVAMFAETMHSLGDAANQFFVFIGSALSKKAPTKRFPGGFGRLVNLVLLFAVLIVGIMSYETIREGIDHLFHPTESTGFYLNISVLALAVVLEFFVLMKAMKEIVAEEGLSSRGLRLFKDSFLYLKKAKPATKLVFLEDLVATGGGLLAMAAVIIAQITPFYQAEGLASIIIGIFMFFVVGRVFLDNAAGAIGESDAEMEGRIGIIAMADPDVRDIQGVSVYKEGENFHVELSIELDSKLTVEQADLIRHRIEDQIIKEKGVSDVIIEYDKDDGILKWKEPDNEQKTT
ncbi:MULTISPECIES: cation diffusion facilitator family transporter [Bacillaceae]|uniref:cation diffusion facilitator family transporter n=1 Tax=Bacillaceae TaxID=186817 RepID=UPI001E32354B|nr:MULTISPECIES: cation diffusion facilitator family transporter [Bacillaceae]MCE4047581.1 cation diffusion facilitator family transporter [Bacillus sp. Au-Bac7]MCM3033856.1 cation diffusion facilitator family transporter [Niallia sp. MER 6]MDL0436191.1 cation diffusion facilitator family transporter [Niallia sp. SS-2023]UPO86074.1 cation diffusion facilitator family transporter [Niallia sp. Man26]